MSRVKGSSFGVRFYRRGIAKTTNVKDTSDIPVQDNAYNEPISATPSESTQAMNEIFEPSVKEEIHLSQELTAPKDKPIKRLDHLVQEAMKREIDYHHEHTTPREQPVDKKQLPERALWIAAKGGDCHAIRLLVMSGVDLDARDSQGRTALNIATQYGQKDATRTLLAAKEMRTMAKLGELPRSAFYNKFKKTGNE